MRVRKDEIVKVVFVIMFEIENRVLTIGFFFLVLVVCGVRR